MAQRNDKKCPKCGADVKTYHTSNGDGTITHRTLCKKRCDGWNPIKEWDTGFSKITKKYYGDE